MASSQGFVVDGQPGHLLLASGLGISTGGGLLTYDGRSVQWIDRVSSTGICVADGRLLRLLRANPDLPDAGELVVYDQKGVERYLRLDVLRDGHDIHWDGNHYVVVSTGTNSVLWIDPAGTVVRRWEAPGHGDAWHLNSLLLVDRELYVSAFGRFNEHRGWKDQLHAGTGFLMNLGTEKEVADGLFAPHSPRCVDGTWVICNSATRELVRIDPSSREVVQRLELNSWTRGVALADDVLFVGESARRDEYGPAMHASIVVLARATWEVLDRIPLPIDEIYDLALAPAALVEGAQVGFGGNSQRVAEGDQLGMFRQLGVEPSRLWAVGDPLGEGDRKVRIRAEIPEALQAASTVELEVEVENLGTALLTSAPPNPVCLSYKWLHPDTGTPLPDSEGLRTIFRRSVPPRTPITHPMTVQVPREVGTFTLCLTVMQEHVAWWDEMDRANACCGPVQIQAEVNPDDLHDPAQ